MIDIKFIAEKIKTEREHLGLTQEELGKLIGISKQSVSSWEKGRNLPDVLNLDKIAALSGKNLADFFAETNTKNSVSCDLDKEFSEKEKQIIYKLRSLPAAKRKAFEVLLGIRTKI